MRILPDHEKLQYSGRIDWTDRKAPVFVFPCTFVRMCFTGEVLKIYVKNKKAYWENYLGCILDGSRQSFCFRMMGKGFWRYRSVL